MENNESSMRKGVGEMERERERAAIEVRAIGGDDMARLQIAKKAQCTVSSASLFNRTTTLMSVPFSLMKSKHSVSATLFPSS
jgi:hypothetical protein